MSNGVRACKTCIKLFARENDLKNWSKMGEFAISGVFEVADFKNYNKKELRHTWGAPRHGINVFSRNFSTFFVKSRSNFLLGGFEDPWFREKELKMLGIHLEVLTTWYRRLLQEFFDIFCQKSLKFFTRGFWGSLIPKKGTKNAWDTPGGRHDLVSTSSTGIFRHFLSKAVEIFYLGVFRIPDYKKRN